MDLQETLTAIGTALLVGGGVALYGWSRHCPRCWWWFVGRTLSRQVEVGDESTSTVLRDGAWVRETTRRTTTHRQLACRNCGHEWWTKNGSVIGGPAPPLPPLPPLAPGARRRRVQVALAGVAWAVLAAGALTLDAAKLSGDAWQVAWGVVGLGLGMAALGAVAALGPWRPCSRLAVSLLALAAVGFVSAEVAQRAVAVPWARAIEARWAESRGATSAAAFGAYLDFEWEVRDALPLACSQHLPTRWSEAVERRDYHEALASDDVVRSKGYLQSAAQRCRELGRTPAQEDEVIAIRARMREVRARLALVREAAAARFRAAAPELDPAAVALVAAILGGTAPQYQVESYAMSPVADHLEVLLRVEVGPALTPERGEASDGGQVRAERLHALSQRAARQAVEALSRDSRGFVLLPRDNHVGGDAVRVSVTCTLTPVPVLGAERGPPAFDVRVEAACVEPPWSPSPWTFRVEADAQLAEPEAAWASLLGRAAVEAARGVGQRLGVAGS